MHLSLISEADLFADAGSIDVKMGNPRQHLDAIVRGVVFAAALLTPFALTFAPAALGHVQEQFHVAQTRP